MKATNTLTVERIRLAAINHLRLMQTGWREVPSVTTGGKAHFYFKPGGPGMERQWIVWDRQLGQWVHEIEQVN